MLWVFFHLCLVIGCLGQINLIAPYFENSSYDATINEQDGLKTLVVKLETYGNPIQMVTYKLVEENNVTDYFAINAFNGDISVRRRVSWDDEKHLTYKLQVLGIEDSKEANTATATVTVHVNRNPLNTASSFIDSTGLVIGENETVSIGTNIIHLTGTDPDESSKLTAPYFENSSYDATINEQDGLKTLVVTVKTYVNPLQMVTYKLVEENNVTDYFAIDAFNGEISVRRRVSWDDMEPLTYKLQVLGIEDSKEAYTATATVTVHVNRNPLNTAPSFIDSTGLVIGENETISIGTNIIHLTATDPDESSKLTAPYFENSSYDATINEQDGLKKLVVTVKTYVNPLQMVTYKLVEENNITDYFAIDAFNGEISVRRRVSWDDMKPLTYKLQVLGIGDSKEAYTATATVTVHVNRNPLNTAPSFIDSTGLVIGENETVSIGTNIIQLTGTDPDKSDPLNGKLHCYFAIDSENGNIYVKRNSEDDQQDVWKITVRVNDEETPPLSYTAKVTIYIQA